MTFFNTFQPFRFSSEYYDSELGLIAYNYRHYNPIDGRFLSRDPIGESGGYNLYGFCNNDPINHTDHLGMKFKPTEESKGKTRRVYVSDQKNGDMRKDLSLTVQLNHSEFDKWARDVRYPKLNSAGPVDKICSASVPNIGYIDVTTYTIAPLAWILLGYRSMVESQWEKEGLKINYSTYSLNSAEYRSSEIKSHFSDHNIYKYMYLGHGNVGCLSMDWNTVLSPVDIQINHHISELRIIACYASDGAVAWKQNIVSDNGVAYLGYGEINRDNIIIYTY